jgi:hypothetical protein
MRQLFFSPSCSGEPVDVIMPSVTTEAWPNLGIYQRFEQAVALVLTLLISGVTWSDFILDLDH